MGSCQRRVKAGGFLFPISALASSFSWCCYRKVLTLPGLSCFSLWGTARTAFGLRGRWTCSGAPSFVIAFMRVIKPYMYWFYYCFWCMIARSKFVAWVSQVQATMWTFSFTANKQSGVVQIVLRLFSPLFLKLHLWLFFFFVLLSFEFSFYLSLRAHPPPGKKKVGNYQRLK